MIDKMRSDVRAQVDYELVCEQFGDADAGAICEFVTEIFLLPPEQEIVIAKQRLCAEAVQARFRLLKREHVEYVLDCLAKNTTEIKNIKSYILAALYNAPTTIDRFFAAKVQHDAARGAWDEPNNRGG